MCTLQNYSQLPQGKLVWHRLKNNFDFEASLEAFKSRLSSNNDVGTSRKL